MTQPDYIADAIKSAADRHGGAMYPHEIERQYREGLAKPKQELAPYAPIQKEGMETDMPDTGALTPSTIRKLKAFSWVSGTASLCAAFIQQAATGAFNQYFGWAILAAAVVFVVSGVAGAVSGGNYSENPTSSNGSNSGGGWHFGKKEEHHHYHQYNQQGPNNQQRNGI